MSKAATSSLADAGITRDDSSKWQRMAAFYARATETGGITLA
jgi:hypothetical protein